MAQAWRWKRPRAGDGHFGGDLRDVWGSEVVDVAILNKKHAGTMMAHVCPDAETGLALPWEQLHAPADESECARVYRYTGHFEDWIWELDVGFLPWTDGTCGWSCGFCEPCDLFRWTLAWQDGGAVPDALQFLTEAGCSLGPGLCYGLLLLNPTSRHDTAGRMTWPTSTPWPSVKSWLQRLPGSGTRWHGHERRQKGH